MPGNFKDEDVRIQRTNEALLAAVSKLLGLRNFSKISVRDLCMEAQIVRATFYYHYKDKYDLLEYWLTKIKSEIISESGAYKDAGKRIDDFVNKNGKIVRHLIEDANSETLGLLCNFMLSLLDMNDVGEGQISPKHFVLSKFCCGGIMNYLQWQATNTSKTDSMMTDSYFYNLLNTLYKWNADHE